VRISIWYVLTAGAVVTMLVPIACSSSASASSYEARLPER
jgi:hypothetical protein